MTSPQNNRNPAAPPYCAGSVRPIRHDPNHMTGALGNVFLVLWRERTTTEAARNFARDLLKFCDRNPKVGLLVISRPRAEAALNAETQDILARAYQDAVPELKCVASVILGTGFLAGTQRGAIASVALKARQPCPIELFSELERAAAWASLYCDGPPALELVESSDAWMRSATRPDFSRTEDVAADIHPR